MAQRRFKTGTGAADSVFYTFQDDRWAHLFEYGVHYLENFPDASNERVELAMVEENRDHVIPSLDPTEQESLMRAFRSWFWKRPRFARESPGTGVAVSHS